VQKRGKGIMGKMMGIADFFKRAWIKSDESPAVGNFVRNGRSYGR